MSKITRALHSTRPVNLAGAPTFTRSREEQVVLALTVGTFEPTFYADVRTLTTQALDLFRAFAVSDPTFLAQAILYAREQGLMRTAPITALAVLSTGGAPAKAAFRQIFPRVIKTPGDLQDFLACVHHSPIRGMGKLVQKAIQTWLRSMSEYHVIKYGSDHQEMSLRDIYRLAKPRPTTPLENALAAYCTKGLVDATLLPQIAGYEAFKVAAKASVNPDQTAEQRARSTVEALALVDAHRLPWEVVTTHFAGNTDAWHVMMWQMPYFALLRNLSNLLKYDVFTAYPDDLSYAVKILTDLDRVALSKILPFQFYSARKRLESETSAHAYIIQALENAMDLAFVNMPYLQGHVLLANDVSESMQSTASERGTSTCAEIAALFAAGAFKRSKDATIVSFATSLTVREVTRDQPLAEIVQQISRDGGGTDLSLPIQYATLHDPPFDTVICFTDNESWVDCLKGISTHQCLATYRQTHPDTRFFFAQLLPYTDAVVPPNEPNCYFLYGWSAATLNFIASICAGQATQVEHIKTLALS